MEKITQKPFENVKKISLDMNVEILDIIDDLSKLTKTNRTVIIGSLVGQGMTPFFRYLERNWNEKLKKEVSEEKKKLAKDLLFGLKKIETKKWNPNP
jgi:ERCC4-related helicase